MNQIDIDYQNLVRDILENGFQKNDRTGTGTISVFGRTIRHSFKDGKFPLLTTKKMAWKTMVTELLWFLRGDTNIKYLVNNGCHIWDGDCYHAYLKKTNHEIELNSAMQTHPHYGLSQQEFTNKIKTDDEFAKKFGELGKIYGFQWRSWNSKSDDELYDNYLKKINNM
jgi:thymidylate synthase